MATLALVLSAISAVASAAALVIALRVRSEVRKLRGKSTQKYWCDSRLGVSASTPSEMQQYRDAVAAPADLSPEARAAALEEWKLSQP